MYKKAIIMQKNIDKLIKFDIILDVYVYYY